MDYKIFKVTHKGTEYLYDGSHFAKARIGANGKPCQKHKRTNSDNIPSTVKTELGRLWVEYLCEARQLPNTIVVTRHEALVSYLRSLGMIRNDTRVIRHASVDDIRGMNVIGVLPLHLAAEAESITEVTLNIPDRLRGTELTLKEVQQFARPPVRYRVEKLD